MNFNTFSILAIEDDQNIVNFLNLLLKREGYEFLYAMDGVSGLEKAKTEMPDLILLDLMLPRMDGLQVCDHLHENPKTKNIPIIVVSAKADIGHKKYCLNRGADDYLTKPFDSEELLLRIKTHIRKSKSRIELIEKLHELREVNTGLQKQNDDLNTIIQILSHDIKNPLTNIIGYSSFFIEEYEKRIQQCMHNIHENANIINGFLSNILVLSQIQQKKDFQNYNMNSIVEEVVRNAHENYKSQQFEVEITDNFPPIYCDPNAIYHIWMNLINNAIKYKRKNVALSIKIGYKNNENVYQFYIKDNGVGINSENLKTIFELFERGKNQDAQGMGIGLTIVQKLVNAHGGKVWAQSSENVGTTIFFTIPKNVCFDKNESENQEEADQ